MNNTPRNKCVSSAALGQGWIFTWMLFDFKLNASIFIDLLRDDDYGC